MHEQAGYGAGGMQCYLWVTARIELLVTRLKVVDDATPVKASLPYNEQDAEIDRSTRSRTIARNGMKTRMCKRPHRRGSLLHRLGSCCMKVSVSVAPGRSWREVAT